MKRAIVITTSILLAISIQAQTTWSKLYKGRGEPFDVGPDGCYYLAGGEADLYKVDKSGNIEWKKDLIDPIFDYRNIMGMCVADNGVCHLVAEYYNDESPIFIEAISYNPDNDSSMWTECRSAVHLSPTNDNGCVSTGYPHLQKIGEWERDYNGFGYGACVQQTSDGGYILISEIRVMIKTDSIGNRLWSIAHSGRFFWIEQTNDGGYIMTGHIGDILHVTKTDSLGNSEWTKLYEISGKDTGGRCVKQTSDGGYIVNGYCRSYSSEEGSFSSAWLLKLDSSGDTLWTRFLNRIPDTSASGRYVEQTDDGGYICCNRTRTDDYENDYYGTWLLKLDSLGNLGVEEPVTPTSQPDWQITTPIGRTITLRAPESLAPIDLAVFDASGRQVDEICLSSSSTTWGQNFSPGVYFIRESGTSSLTRKVILVR